MGTTLAKFRIESAKNFLDSFKTASNNLTYSFIGKTLPFEDDNNIDEYSDTNISYNETWKNMLSFKKVLTTDISLGIKRHDWTLNTIYDMYDDTDGNLYTKKFYCMNTDNYAVYKCLDNNNNAPSTVKPETISTDVITLADGYKWKYMYTLDAVDVTKFLNPTLIPIKILTSNDGSQQWNVQNNTTYGTLDRISIEQNEATFTSVPNITIEGDGTGATALAVLSGNILSNIIITNQGSNYTYIKVYIAGYENTITLRGILSPIHGHGYNASEELFATNTITNFIYDGDEDGTFIVSNDYRTIGLLRNPTDFETDSLIDIAKGSQLTKINLEGESNFSLDETVIGSVSGAKGTIVSSSSNLIGLNNVIGTFLIGESIIGQTSLETNNINSITNPKLKFYSGTTLYVGYRAPIQRTSTAVESYKLNIYF